MMNCGFIIQSAEIELLY